MKTSPHRWDRDALGAFLRQSFEAVPTTVSETRAGIASALHTLAQRPATEWVRPDHLVEAVVADVCADSRTGELRTDLGLGISTAADALSAIVDGWAPPDVYPDQILVECHAPYTAPGGEIPAGWDFSVTTRVGPPTAVVTKDIWFDSRGPWIPAHTYGGADGADWHGLALTRLGDGRWVGDLYLHSTPPRDMLIAVHPALVLERLRVEYGFSPFGASRVLAGEAPKDFAPAPISAPRALTR